MSGALRRGLRSRIAGSIGIPDGLLQRVRWLFVAFSVTVDLLVIPEYLQDPAPSGRHLAVALGSYLVLATWSVVTFRTRGRLVALDLVPPVAILSGALAIGSADAMFASAFVTLYAHALYGGRRRVVLVTIGYYVAYQLGVLLVPDANPFLGTEAFTLLAGFGFSAGLMHALGRLIGTTETVSSADAILTDTGADLLASTDVTTVLGIAFEGARRLATLSDGTEVSVWRTVEDGLELVGSTDDERLLSTVPLGNAPEDLALALASGRTFAVRGDEAAAVQTEYVGQVRFEELLITPLQSRDRSLGVVVLASRNPLPSALADALGRLSLDASLALDRAELTSELARREHLFRGVIEGSSDVIAVIDADEVVRFVSPAVESLFGFQPEDLVGLSLADILHEEDAPGAYQALHEATTSGAGIVFECRLRHRDGSWRHTEVTLNQLADDRERFVVNVRDVTERKRLEAEITYRAYHDPLTGLANRTLFSDRVVHALEAMTRTDSAIGVVFIDLDDFKTINDNLGHAAGDHLLVQVAERLRGVMRVSDTAARLGGDEFALLIENVQEHQDVVEAVERVIEAVREPVTLQGKSVVVRASAGIAMAYGSLGTDATTHAQELMRNADVAMYAAKSAGKDGYEVFSSTLHVAELERLEMRNDLEHALDRGELALVFQPIVDLRSMQVVEMEALLRWRHPERGQIPPVEFIPIAEETRLIVPIGRWVVQEACRHAATWADLQPAGTRPIGVSVNLSAVQLEHPLLVDEIASALRLSGLDPSFLTLEMTETALTREPAAAARVLAELKGLGVRIAIDDFGSGYASFGYLQRYPVDVLKVDRSFVNAIRETGEEGRLANAIVTFAHTMRVETVAEGIEEEGQERHLRRWGYTYGQGFYYAVPMPPAEIRTWMTGWSGRGDRPALTAS